MTTEIIKTVQFNDLSKFNRLGDAISRLYKVLTPYEREFYESQGLEANDWDIINCGEVRILCSMLDYIEYFAPLVTKVHSYNMAHWGACNGETSFNWCIKRAVFNHAENASIGVMLDIRASLSNKEVINERD